LAMSWLPWPWMRWPFWIGWTQLSLSQIWQHSAKPF
jgi:hypothetical protein